MKTSTLLLTGLLVSSSSLMAHSNKIEQALNHVERPQQDKSRDAARKPKQILQFMDIKPKMTVIDFVAGRGYYTEIFAQLLDKSGKLYSVKPKLDKRDLSRFNNVTVLKTLDLSDIKEPVDRIFTALNYHDLINNKGIDRPKMLKSIHSKLKDDGYLIVIDHNAGPGIGLTQTKKLHRVENAFVLNEVLEAGFTLDSSSSVLANPDDHFELDVWQKSTKGKTDRFVYRFKKAAKR